MSLIAELQDMKNLYTKLREHLYSYPDHYTASEEEYLMRTPWIDSTVYKQFREGLADINDYLDSTLLADILDLLDESSNLSKYVAFNSQSYQMDFIQEQMDAYEEKLDAYQEQAASLASEKEQEIWDEAEQDVRALFEDLLPKIF
ncbi:hypothetical protein ACIQXQ_05290 [Peribacillus sp. NPDC097198]|uniref:hypothetical protein n=1 Tax=Peribacillus sp. NPDC097198 TaxID=3364397 RepID=UPI003816B53A